MIELTKYQQDRSIWLNESNIETMEAHIVRDGNGDAKSSYVDIYMVSGRVYRVENTIKYINDYIQTAGK